MRKSLGFVLLFACLALPAQEKKKDIVKKGINVGPLPAVGYSSDRGWHYGVLADIFWYGDGSKYPDYVWKLNVETSWYSKGNSVYHAYFDSKHLVPGLRLSASVSYLGNKTSNFYGFNGTASRYVQPLDRITAGGAKDFGYAAEGQGFYLMRRDILRAMMSAQGKFGDSHWGWVGGLQYWGIWAGHAENKGLSGYDKTAKTPANDLSLYDLYVKHGLINAHEAKGGHHLEIKAGVVFDTRNHENNPGRGTNLEAYFIGSPDILNGNRGGYRNHYLMLVAHFKQFFTLVPDQLVFGGHLAYQGVIAGKAPFYLLQNIQTINMKQIILEGLGSTNTLRGTVINRLMGNGYAWANFELRWTFFRFHLFNQNFALATNPFFDMGMIVHPYKAEGANFDAFIHDQTPVNTVTNLKTPEVTDYVAGNFYNPNQKQSIHLSAGLGLHVIMNQNFNVNFEFGKAFFDGQKIAWKNNDGHGIGINVALNWIF